MELQFTGLYACALAIIFIVLQYSVIMRRVSSEISINYGDDLVLATKIRQHGNFIETAPLALILMLIVETSGASATWMHAIGGLLLVGRILHPMGLKSDFKINPLRIAGTTATQFSIITSVVYVLWSAMA